MDISGLNICAKGIGGPSTSSSFGNVRRGSGSTRSSSSSSRPPRNVPLRRNMPSGSHQGGIESKYESSASSSSSRRVRRVSGSRASQSSSSSSSSSKRHSVNSDGRYVFNNSVKDDKCEDYVNPEGREATMKPTGMYRAKCWSPEVEEAFRLQFCGWRDIFEFRAVYGQEVRWELNNFIRRLQCKNTGNYVYWSQDAECESKHLNQVKVYTYGEKENKRSSAASSSSNRRRSSRK